MILIQQYNGLTTLMTHETKFSLAWNKVIKNACKKK